MVDCLKGFTGLTFSVSLIHLHYHLKSQPAAGNLLGGTLFLSLDHPTKKDILSQLQSIFIYGGLESGLKQQGYHSVQEHSLYYLALYLLKHMIAISISGIQHGNGNQQADDNRNYRPLKPKITSSEKIRTLHFHN